MTKLVGILGKKRSGKDTVSDFLVKEHGYHQYAFAGPLKEAVKEMFLMTENQVNGDEKEVFDERWNITPRKLMQIIGTELFHYDIHKYTEPEEFDMGREVWVNRFKIWYKDNEDKNVVVSDVRFEHEANKIRELGGEVWKVVRPNLESSDAHASESEMESIVPDHLINNDSTIEDLYKKVDSLL